MKICLVILFLFVNIHAMTQKLDREQTIQLLALGDSYTIGESVAEDQRWPVQLMNRLKEKGYKTSPPTIIATTGWRTDDLKRAILAQKPSKDYTLVSLLIGVNNQYQGRSSEDYAPEFEELLNMAINFAGGKKDRVFVVSIPDYGYTPFGKAKQTEISRELDKFNKVNRSVAAQYGIQYFDITPISRHGLEDPSLVAEDNLHPSGKMYSKWVDLIVAGLIQ